MRLIDADALELDMQDQWEQGEISNGEWINFRETLKRQPTVDAVERWIPVTERLPEEDYCTGRGVQYSESVLITVINRGNDDETFVDMAYTADGEWQLNFPQDDTPLIPKWCEAVAWMPLPKPWKGADDD